MIPDRGLPTNRAHAPVWLALGAALSLASACGGAASTTPTASAGSGGAAGSNAQAGTTTSAGSVATSGGPSGGSGHAGGAPAGGAGGANANGGAKANGGGSGQSCALSECFVATVCVDHCGGAIVSSGCCSCVAPAVDEQSCGGSSGSAGSTAVDCQGPGLPKGFPSFDRSCSESSPCSAVVHQLNCCGTRIVTGISATEVARFTAAEQTCEAQYPECECAQGATTTDTGQVVSGLDAPVECHMGTCTTYTPFAASAFEFQPSSPW